jgi:hypothetical protein
MRVDLLPQVVHVSLSERNVLALAGKLAQRDSYRTIVSRNVHGPDGELRPCVLVVSIEDNAEHYAGREPAGLMHPVTEEIVRRMVDELDGDARDAIDER